jgi:hypothetical protein
MKTTASKLAAAAVLVGLGATPFLSAPAMAGADEAHMWSFMTGTVPNAAPTTEARGHDVPDTARAYYDGHGSRMHHAGSYRYHRVQ